MRAKVYTFQYRTSVKQKFVGCSISFWSLLRHLALENHLPLFASTIFHTHPDKVWPFSVPAPLLFVVWAALYAGCQLAVELISGLPRWLADPIRLWKLGWLDWHTPSNPASNRLWPYTGVWLLRTSRSRPVQAFLNNPNIDHRGFFLTAAPCRNAGVLNAFLEEVSSPYSHWGMCTFVAEGLNSVLFSANRRSSQPSSF